MSRENCMCETCLNTSCAYDRQSEIDALENQVSDIKSQLETANSLIATLKHVIDFLLENL